MKFRSKAERLEERDRRNAELKAKTAAKLQAIDDKLAERTAKREAEYAAKKAENDAKKAENDAQIQAGVAKMKQGLRKMRDGR